MLAATTNGIYFLSLHLILHPCLHFSAAQPCFDSIKSFTHYHSTSPSIFPLHHHELDTKWVYEHLCYDSLIKPIIVAVHFAAVQKRFTVSAAIRHRHTVVFSFLVVVVLEDEPLESRGGV